MWGILRGLVATILVTGSLVFVGGAPASAVDPLPTECQVAGAIVGTDASETLTGTGGDDIICALDGNDTIDGGAGNDTIIGGGGNDTVNAGDGNDTVSGGAGDDTITGGAGDDELGGDDGTDILYGGPGADNLFGGNGPDSLLGGADNDGLRGDEGADALNGESGINTCARDVADTVSGCFYDSKGPQIISAAINPDSQNIHALGVNPRVHARFLISDPGTGVSTGMQFVFGWNGVHKDRMVHGTESLIADSHWFANATPDDCTALAADLTLSGICLLKGNINRGIYDAYFAVPKNTNAGKWSFLQFSATDRVGNSTVWGSSVIKAKKLNISFRQLDTNVDIWGPKITPLGVAGSKNQNSESEYVHLRVRSQDASGLGSFSAGYVGVSGESIQATVDVNTPLCSSALASSVLCVESANLNDTVIQIPVRYRDTSTNPDYKLYGKKTICLCNFDLYDSLGNTSNITYLSSSGGGKKLSFVKNYVTPRPVDDRDRSAPVLKALTSQTAAIDTGSEDQVINLTVTVTDKGVGFDMANLGGAIRVSLKGSTAGAAAIYCGADSSTVVGNKNSLSVTVRCPVPAHYPRGAIKVDSLTFTDNSLRRNSYDRDMQRDGLYKVSSAIKRLAITNG